MSLTLERAKGGLIAGIGFLLSPFTWWNDIFINFPLAYLFAIPFALISEDFFTPMLVVGYWLTNIIGIIMMRHGAVKTAKGAAIITRKAMVIDFCIAGLYTIGMLVLIRLEILQPLSFD